MFLELAERRDACRRAPATTKLVQVGVVRPPLGALIKVHQCRDFKRQEGAHAHEQPTLPNRSLLRGLIEAHAGKLVMLLLGRRARVLERTSTIKFYCTRTGPPGPC